MKSSTMKSEWLPARHKCVQSLWYVNFAFLLLLLTGCGGTDEMRWKEQVYLHDGKLILVERYSTRSVSGFPNSRRGNILTQELRYAQLGVVWKVEGAREQLRSFDIVIRSGEGDDIVDGGDDNDTILGGTDNDIIDGGTGNDSLYSDNGTAMTYDYVSADANPNGIDIINGGEGNDFVWGQGGNDRLFGGDGDDRLEGGAGDDTLAGDEGNDQKQGHRVYRRVRVGNVLRSYRFSGRRFEPVLWIPKPGERS